VIQASPDELGCLGDIIVKARRELFPQVCRQGRRRSHVLHTKPPDPIGRPLRYPGLYGRFDGRTGEEALQQPAGRQTADIVGRVEVRSERGVNPEEAIDILHGLRRTPLEIVEQKHVYPIARKGIEVSFQLLMVPADLHPTGVGTRPDGFGMQIARGVEGSPPLAQVHLIVRVCPVDRVAQTADDADGRDHVLDPASRLGTFKIDR